MGQDVYAPDCSLALADNCQISSVPYRHRPQSCTETPKDPPNGPSPPGDTQGLAMSASAVTLTEAAIDQAQPQSVRESRGEHTKKYSTANTGLITGMFRLTCMLIALLSFRPGQPCFQL